MSKYLALLMMALVTGLVACRSTPASEAAVTTLDYEVRFRGNEAFTGAELRARIVDNLLDFRRSNYGKAAIDDAAYVIERYYRDAGFHEARVEYEVDREAQRVVLNIAEGPRLLMGRVALRGVDSVDVIDLRRLIGSAGINERWYSDSRVARAASATAGWYRALGFLDVQVEVGELKVVDGVANVALIVTEGPAYRLGAVFFGGELVFDQAQLDKLAAVDIGQPYTPRRAARLLGRVETFHTDRGYADVEIDLGELQRSGSGAVNLVLEIRPGPRVEIVTIRVEGAGKTRDAFVRQRLAFREGDFYSAKAERESFRWLYATGLFSRIELELEGSGERRDLVVRVEEAQGLELFVEPGWGSYDRARIRAGVRERNLFGTGRIGRLEALYSERTANAQIGLTDPWFLGSDISADASIGYTRREEPSFEYEDNEFDFGLLRHWGDGDSGTLSYRFRNSNLIGDDLVTQTLGNISDDINVSAVRMARLRDTRNNLVVPSSGQRTEFTLEVADEAIGSEVDFVRGTVSYSRYWFLGGRSVLATSIRTGVIDPTGSTGDIPLQERFFNGGENSVRSYRESELGPTDPAGNPVGGEAFSTYSLELRQDLPGRLEGALFFDAGNVELKAEEYLEFNDFGYAVGIGLRYVLPVGPLRLDLGINPDPADGEDDFVLHFSIGRPF